MHEFLGNTDKAVSCYRDAFESASLLRKEDTKLSSFGIKAIVGLINFRMTHALLNANRVHDAILQFVHFTRKYGNRIEADEYVPRHWGWMTEIYSEFGTYLSLQHVLNCQKYSNTPSLSYRLHILNINTLEHRYTPREMRRRAEETNTRMPWWW